MDPATATNTTPTSVQPSMDDTPPAPFSPSPMPGSDFSSSPVSAVPSSTFPTSTLNPPLATDQGNTIPPVPPTTATGSPTSGGTKKRRNVILIAVAVFLMLGGIGAGTVLVQRQQFQESFAWDCSLYTFSVDQNGTVSVVNGSSRNEPLQRAEVYIDGQLVQTFDVPELDSGEGATLGTIQVPSNGQFSWQVVGTKDCQNTGNYTVQTHQAQCLAIKAFDEDGTQLSVSDLAELSAGDVVRFTVAGTTTSGEITGARFTINGELGDETTEKRPGTDEFYIDYTIPEDVSAFSISAELYHHDIGWF